MYSLSEVVYGTPTSDMSNRGNHEQMDDGVEEPTEMGVEVIHR